MSCYLCADNNDIRRMNKGPMATCVSCKNTVHMGETMSCRNKNHQNHRRSVCDRCYFKNECNKVR